MSNEIEITTKFCHPYMNFGGDGCNYVVLKVPQLEAVKLQTVAHSNTPDLGQFNQNYLMSGMGLVLFCYILSYAIGQVLRMIRH